MNQGNFGYLKRGYQIRLGDFFRTDTQRLYKRNEEFTYRENGKRGEKKYILNFSLSGSGDIRRFPQSASAYYVPINNDVVTETESGKTEVIETIEPLSCLSFSTTLKNNFNALYLRTPNILEDRVTARIENNELKISINE